MSFKRSLGKDHNGIESFLFIETNGDYHITEQQDCTEVLAHANDQRSLANLCGHPDTIEIDGETFYLEMFIPDFMTNKFIREGSIDDQKYLKRVLYNNSDYAKLRMTTKRI